MSRHRGRATQLLAPAKAATESERKIIFQLILPREVRNRLKIDQRSARAAEERRKEKSYRSSLFVCVGSIFIRRLHRRGKVRFNGTAPKVGREARVRPEGMSYTATQLDNNDNE